MNFKPLILCFFAATLFWILDTLSRGGYTTKIDYPIEFQYDQNQYIPLQQLPQKVTIDLTSTGWDLIKKSFKINQSPLIYQLANPLTISQLNTNLLKNSFATQLPHSQINYIESETLSLQFDKKITKNIILKIDSLNLNLANGYAISSAINISPNAIQLIGAESVLKNYPDFILLKINKKNISNNFDEKINIDYPKNSFIKTSAEKALVSFEVAELLNK
jgi:hypothetical protein